ncbi:PhrK family phosphatase-inhibitory pheromone [Bacillus swezeyi]|nr:PhrK family phosphatase-inhibitory pheromone [Bacillus swezeyi]KAA6476139.1 phosphatase [Bacillus swezeyi]
MKKLVLCMTLMAFVLGGLSVSGSSQANQSHIHETAELPVGT